MSVKNMLPLLKQYPRRQEAELLIEGFSVDFYIPHVNSSSSVFSGNFRSITENPRVAQEKLDKEVELSKMAGPFSVPPLSNRYISLLGLEPKKESGKFRLIQHLSFPPGESVNDDISRTRQRCSMFSFDKAWWNKWAQLVKSDIESAFYLLLVHPDSFYLLGCLPMGCSISCRYFNVLRVLPKT